MRDRDRDTGEEREREGVGGGGLGVRERLSHFLVAFPSDLGSTNFLLSLRRQPKLFDDEEQQQDEGTKKISHSLREILCVETRWERERERHWLQPGQITLKSKVAVDHLGAVSLTMSKTWS